MGPGNGNEGGVPPKMLPIGALDWFAVESPDWRRGEL